MVFFVVFFFLELLFDMSVVMEKVLVWEESWGLGDVVNFMVFKVRFGLGMGFVELLFSFFKGDKD